MLPHPAHRQREVSRQPPLLLIIGGILLGSHFSVHSASAETATTRRESEIVSSLASVGETFAVGRRAPRETLLRSAAATPRPPTWVHLDATASGTRNQDRVGDAPGIKIAGISLTTKSPATMSQRGPNDRLGDPAHKTRWSDGRNATSSGLSLDAVSGVGWLVGALGIGVGTYLLVTSDKSKGRETTLGADFYSKGVGLRVRRRW